MLATIFWCGALVLLVLVASGIGLAKRGLPLEGWIGPQADQIIGWTALTAPYVFLAGLPVALCAIGITSLLKLSRRWWIALSMGLAIGLLMLFGAAA
jgi:hypothetical protein